MRYISLLVLFATAYATELAPWFTPPLEFQGRTTCLYQRVKSVHSPLGTFNAPSNNASMHLSLGLTPWPSWNMETELFLTHTSTVDLGFEAALFTLRHAWFDDIAGDAVSLVTGATLSFPSRPFLHNLSFPYHGHVNAEFHAALGKEWARCQDWIFHLWGLAGFGIANRGSPWLHSLAIMEGKTSARTTTGLFADAVFGLGKDDLLPQLPFLGYASIAHRNIDLGVFFTYCIPYFGTLSLLGWYSLHTHNFVQHYWGASLSLSAPFNLITKRFCI
jgi:hypothetical protein